MPNMDIAYNWKIAERTNASDVLDKLKHEGLSIDREKVIEALAFALGHLNLAVPIIAELVGDIEAVGGPEVIREQALVSEGDFERGWPDLADTYDKAKGFLERDVT